MTSFAPLTGGCLCGEVRYRVSAAPLDSGYCHCTICRGVSGSAVQAWAEIPIAGFDYTAGMPSIYRSSDWGERRFCSRCGSHLEFRMRSEPSTVALNVPTLDDPEALPPHVHIWVKDRLSWFDCRDELPRYRQDAPLPAAAGAPRDSAE